MNFRFLLIANHCAAHKVSINLIKIRFRLHPSERHDKIAAEYRDRLLWQCDTSIPGLPRVALCARASERNRRQSWHTALGSLAAMARSGSVPLLLLPLLLASAVAYDYEYEKLAGVTNAVPHPVTYPMEAESDCADLCNSRPRCSGYVFEDGVCRPYMGDCEVAPDDPPAPHNYMSKMVCPRGENTARRLSVRAVRVILCDSHRCFQWYLSIFAARPNHK